MKMAIWQVRLPPDLDRAIRDEAQRRGIKHSDVFRSTLRRGLDTTPETLAGVVDRAIERADRRVLRETMRDLPARLKEVLDQYISGGSEEQ